MFVQPLRLDPQTNYETSASEENVVENMLLSCSRVPIVTLYASKAAHDDAVLEKLQLRGVSVELSVAQYKAHAGHFDSSHIIVRDFGLLDSFGYALEDFDKPLIVEAGSGFKKLPLCRFLIKAEKNERFVAVFMLAQCFRATIFTKDTNRARIFCKIFKLDCDVRSMEECAGRIESECAIFLDGYREIECERVFVLGAKPARFQLLSLDLGDAGKFKYRIADVMRRVSPGVARRIDSFDYAPYAHINN
ncbi:hypothetical protein PAPHI01_2209 [Pancytospora philotis]|nr:hypothetical protein PAPHI01_2209 [Pancytospora philotis]